MTDIEKCRDRLRRLSVDLGNISNRDPEQEVQGMALPVIDAVISEARDVLKDDRVAAAIADVISMENIEAAEPLRAVDALLVVNQLLAALPERESQAYIINPDIERRSPWRT